MKCHSDVHLIQGMSENYKKMLKILHVINLIEFRFNESIHIESENQILFWKVNIQYFNMENSR